MSRLVYRKGIDLVAPVVKVGELLLSSLLDACLLPPV